MATLEPEQCWKEDKFVIYLVRILYLTHGELVSILLLLSNNRIATGWGESVIFPLRNHIEVATNNERVRETPQGKLN